MPKPDANGWYPIGRPPKASTVVDLWWSSRFFGGRIIASMQRNGEWLDMDDRLIDTTFVTHWRYPPKPPVEFEEKGDD